jgi:hypothetical protein
MITIDVKTDDSTNYSFSIEGKSDNVIEVFVEICGIISCITHVWGTEGVKGLRRLRWDLESLTGNKINKQDFI